MPGTIGVRFVHLTRGIHHIKVQYYQGPRFDVALVLEIAVDKATYNTFKASDYIPSKVAKLKRRTEIVLSDDCLFDFNRAEVKEDSKGILDDVVRLCLAMEDYRTLLISGHSDNIGTYSQNVYIL